MYKTARATGGGGVRGVRDISPLSGGQNRTDSNVDMAISAPQSSRGGNHIHITPFPFIFPILTHFKMIISCLT